MTPRPFANMRQCSSSARRGGAIRIRKGEPLPSGEAAYTQESAMRQRAGAALSGTKASRGVPSIAISRSEGNFSIKPDFSSR